MEMRLKILNAVKFVSASILSIGTFMFLLGFFVMSNNLLISLGIGSVMGAVFIFLMGVVFVATEEMLEKRYIDPDKTKKRSALL